MWSLFWYFASFAHHVPESAVIITHTVLGNIYEHNIFHTGLVIKLTDSM